jgi:hypothetical protein
MDRFFARGHRQITNRPEEDKSENKIGLFIKAKTVPWVGSAWSLALDQDRRGDLHVPALMSTTSGAHGDKQRRS